MITTLGSKDIQSGTQLEVELISKTFHWHCSGGMEHVKKWKKEKVYQTEIDTFVLLSSISSPSPSSTSCT